MATTTEIVKANVAQIEDLLRQSQDRIAAVLPGHLKADRFLSVALELVTGDTKLSLCEPLSVIKCIMEASELGLLLNKHLGHGYLVPFRNGALTQKLGIQAYTAEFLIGYRGFVDMVMRSNPAITSAYARLVYEGEEFYLEEGTRHELIHKPKLVTPPLKECIGAYAAVLYRDQSPRDFEWMSMDEILKVKDFSKATGPESPWQTWTEEMIKKTPIRRLCKRMKLSPDFIAATVRDEYRELGYEGIERPAIAMPRRASERMIDTGSESPAPQQNQPVNGTQSQPSATKQKAESAPPAQASPANQEPTPGKPNATLDSKADYGDGTSNIKGVVAITRLVEKPGKKPFMAVTLKGVEGDFTTFNKDHWDGLSARQGKTVCMDYQVKSKAEKTYRTIVEFWVEAQDEVPL